MTADDPEILDPDDLSADAVALRGTPGQDRLRTLTLTWLQAIPHFGGALAEVVGAVVPAARERRLQDLVERIAADVDALWDQLDSTLVDDTFAETVETAIEQAMRSAEEAKRAAYAAIVVNSLTPARPSEEERLFFLDVVGQSRSLHLLTLNVAATTSEIPEGIINAAPKSVLLPRLGVVDENLVSLVWNDLSRWGFVSVAWGGMAGTVSRAGLDLSVRVTPLGRRFLAFVSAPDATPDESEVSADL